VSLSPLWLPTVLLWLPICPAAQPGPVAPATRAFRLPPVAVLAGLVIAVIVLVNVATIGWGVLWLLVPELLVARHVIGHASAPSRPGSQN